MHKHCSCGAGIVDYKGSDLEGKSQKKEDVRLQQQHQHHHNQQQLEECANEIFNDEIGKTFFATTAFGYANGPPHIGHTYEIVITDVTCRFRRLFGNVVKCISGTDEHGIKVANAAQRNGTTPFEFARLNSAKFYANVSNMHCQIDDFVRTTEPRHIKCAQKVWRTIQAKGDVYLGEYNGWYNEREETFVNGQEAASTNYCDPLSGKPYLVMKEPSYFFKMERYRAQLLSCIKNKEMLVRPQCQYDKILRRLEQGPLEDLSISRASIDWGIPVPGDASHVMYVWFDVLSNYLTAANFQDGVEMWPIDCQFFGKDIAWFQVVVFPCILLALGLPLPRVVFGHGLIMSADGRKMSKSLGNVIDTNALVEKYGASALRFYLVYNFVLGEDPSFNVAQLKAVYRRHVVGTIFALVHKSIAACKLHCGGRVPQLHVNVAHNEPLNIRQLLVNVKHAIDDYDLKMALENTMQAYNTLSDYWSQQTSLDQYIRDGTFTLRLVRLVLECHYVLTHLVQPIVPMAAAKIFGLLNTPQKLHLGLVSLQFDNLVHGTIVDVLNEIAPEGDLLQDGHLKVFEFSHLA